MGGRSYAACALTAWAIAPFLLAGCYAKSVPMPPRAAAEPSTKAAVPRPTLLAAVRSSEHGDNVGRIQPERLVQRFAERLYDATIFSDVVYPLTERSPAVPDVVFEISVASSYDLHPVSNLAKDVAVGLSILLLQPVLPTAYDLEVTLATRGVGTETKPELLGTGQTRFEFNWLRAPDDSIEQWHRDTTDRAIDELVDRIAARYGARKPLDLPPS